MMSATDQVVTRPETYRLPKPGTGDPYFGFSRSFHYTLNKRFQAEGKGKLLIRITAPGRTRGVTLVNYKLMAAYVAAQMEETK